MYGKVKTKKEKTIKKKYDMISLPQVIYFLESREVILKKITHMLNPKGIIFIVDGKSMPNYLDYDKKKYPENKFCNKEHYKSIAESLGLKIIDWTEYQSDIAIAFMNGKIMALLRVLLFMIRIKKSIFPMKGGNNTFILLERSGLY